MLFDVYESSFSDTNAGNATQHSICRWVASAESTSTGEEWLILIWSGVMLLSCIPMTLSSIYKEIALGDAEMELDPVYLNGWVAIFQFGFSLLLAIPAGLVSSPVVPPEALPRNLWDGLLCYVGVGSIETGCHPDDMCATHAALFFNLSLLFNVIFNLLMMMILKLGSSNLLYLALTVMVPIGNLAFALPLMPQKYTFHMSDILGLAVIMGGLVMYRFADASVQTATTTAVDEDQLEQVTNLAEPNDDLLLEGSTQDQLRQPLLVAPKHSDV
jgi:hypothetical protein